ncbi:hypothetical protein BU15DRAFT_70315 [Melanogaster broomeanus]|nr:hypothetical protein BU15DRAFT_70315 [Melanogaster broomeanus]
MYNAFLVIRTIFFALLLYLNVLIFVFASWNIAATKSSEMSAPGASVFLLVNSIFIFGFVFLASVAEIICAKARPAHVRVECLWTVFMSTLQLAASINVTLNGRPMSCQMQSPWGSCASSSLLVPVSWLATLIVITYSLTICITSATHSTSLPSIWTTPVSAVPWFGTGAAAPGAVLISQPATRQNSKAFSSSSSDSEESCAVTKYIAERWEKLSGMERQSGHSGPMLFSKGRHATSPSEKRPTAPLPPSRTHIKEVVAPRDSHYVEVCRQSDMSSTLTLQTPTVFPKTTDPDLPIPLPRLSEWIQADAGRKVAVRTKPPMLP